MTKKQPKDFSQQRLKMWRPIFPDHSDAELAEIVRDIDDYLRIAWKVFRSLHPDEDLQEEIRCVA